MALDGFRVVQIGIVVSDLERAVVAYSTRFGWGPWRQYDSVPPRFFESIFGGAGMRIAIASVGELDVELIEPLDGISQHGQFLRKHGPGINHLLVRNYESGQEIPVDPSTFGHPLLGQGTFGNDVSFSYVDARTDFGAIFEFVRGSTAASVPPDRVIPKKQAE